MRVTTEVEVYGPVLNGAESWCHCKLNVWLQYLRVEFEPAEVFCEGDKPKSTNSEIPRTGCSGKKQRGHYKQFFVFLKEILPPVGYKY
jgi:hypothetical protein